MELTVIETKIITIVLLGCVSIILGFLPLLLRKIGFIGEETSFWKRAITSVLLCFGGGVLFAISFVHLLPEIRENVEASHIDFDVPFAEIMMCCGFFLIYFIEEFVHALCDRSVHEKEEETLHKMFSVQTQSCSHHHEYELNASPIPEHRVLPKEAHQHNGPPINYQTFDSGNKQVNLQHVNVERLLSNTSSSTSSSDQGKSKSSALRDFFTVLALCFHAIFEGLAVGLEQDSGDVWKLFAGVATHKYVLSFCVGLELVQSGTRTSFYIAYMLVFALVSPLGIGIGITITYSAAESEAYLLAVAVLQALAGGTIIYVVVFEVLQRERENTVPGLLQFLFLIMGFSTMLCIEVFAGHEHSHEESGQNVTMSTL